MSQLKQPSDASSPETREEQEQRKTKQPNGRGETSLWRVDRVSDSLHLVSRQSQDAVQTDTFDNGVQANAVPFSAKQFPLHKDPQGWKKRPRSPGLKWYKGYDTPESLKNGRVLVIDYVKQGRHFH